MDYKKQFQELNGVELMLQEGIYMYIGNNIEFAENHTFTTEHIDTKRIEGKYVKSHSIDIIDIDTEEEIESYFIAYEFEHSDQDFAKIILSEEY